MEQLNNIFKLLQTTVTSMNPDDQSSDFKCKPEPADAWQRIVSLDFASLEEPQCEGVSLEGLNSDQVHPSRAIENWIQKRDESFVDRLRMAKFADRTHQELRKEQASLYEEIRSLKRQQREEMGLGQKRFLQKRIDEALDCFKYTNSLEQQAMKTAKVQKEHLRAKRSTGIAVFRQSRSSSPVRHNLE